MERHKVAYPTFYSLLLNCNIIFISLKITIIDKWEQVNILWM